MSLTIKKNEEGDATYVSFDVGDVKAFERLENTDYEANGYFWESLVQHAFADAEERFELDSEGDMFCAYAEEDDLRAMIDFLQPLVDDGEAALAYAQKAEAEGFEIDC